MSSVSQRRLSEQEYLARERAATYRSEFYRGETFALAGASRAHNLIAANIARSFGNQLAHGPCEVYQSDMKVRGDPTGLYTVLVEVLSESTAEYDLWHQGDAVSPTGLAARVLADRAGRTVGRPLCPRGLANLADHPS